MIVGEDATVTVDDYGFLWVDLTAARVGKGKAKALKPKVRGVRRKAKPAKAKTQALGRKVKAAKPRQRPQNSRPCGKAQSSKLKAQKESQEERDGRPSKGVWRRVRSPRKRSRFPVYLDDRVPLHRSYRRRNIWHSKFDPITLEILWRRLISVVDEADSTVARTAFSSLLRDAHDYTCMFTDRKGRELAQGTFATPGQSGAMALGIKNLVKKLPASSYKPGDVFITNDPWALAGHLNDVCVMSPIFYKGKIVAFTACVFHHSDIGGRVSSDNHEVFEEGLFIPLVKLYDGGVLNESVLDMIRWNVRTPDEVIGDIRSQIAANHVCAEKICQMLQDNDLDDLDDLADEVIGRTEKSMREAIGKIPDGIYRAEGIVEQMEGRADIVIKAAIEVKGSDIIVDLEGSSPQVDWGGNVVYNFTYAYVHMAVKSMFDPYIPNNDGCARPIT